MTSRIHLTDREIERFLRTRSTAPDIGLFEEIMTATRAIPQERPRWRLAPQSRRLTILWAALLLTALLVGATLAGAGLLPLPWPTDRDQTNIFPLAGPITNCHRPLPDGVVLTVVDFQEASQLTVYMDGLAVQGSPVGWGIGAENGLDGTWQQRRLTTAGIERLIDDIAVAVPDCRQIQADVLIEIQARRHGVPYAVRIGQDVIETRVTTEAEAAAAGALAHRLAAPDLGLPAGEWVDASWTAYEPDRWQVWLRFMPADASGWASGDEIVLPDGSGLRTLGREADTGEAGATVRCGVVGIEEAMAIATILTDAGGRPPPDRGGDDAHWYFTVGGAKEAVQISVVGLLPHEPDCVDASTALASPTPAPAPSIEAGGAAPFESACDYLPENTVRDVVGAINGPSEDYPGWSADWSFCWYPLEEDGLWIASVRHPTPAERAAEQASSLFGDQGLVASEIAGRDVFLNACARSEGVQCRAAIAISAEPHFVVASWVGGSAATLRDLAERVIHEIVQR